jgi:hypothetical protein
MSDTNQLAVNEKHGITVPELQVMAKSLGPLFKKTPDQMFALMLIAQAENLHPAIAAQEYDIIDGRPAINSRSALARFQKSGGTVEYVERTESVCTINFSHPGGGKIVVSWTIKMAEQAGLLNKDNWKKYKRAMLAARCIAEGIRALYPACLSGLYTVDEVQDFPEMRDVSPPSSPAPEEKSAREEVIKYIASVSNQISASDLAAIKSELKEAQNDIEKLKAVKEHADRIIESEPTIKPVTKMSEAEEAEVSAAFDGKEPSKEPVQQEIF